MSRPDRARATTARSSPSRLCSNKAWAGAATEAYACPARQPHRYWVLVWSLLLLCNLGVVRRLGAVLVLRSCWGVTTLQNGTGAC